MNEKIRNWRIGLVIMGVLFLSGCAIMPTRGEVGKPFDEELIGKIQPGKTTRKEIAQWFGVPVAVAKKGEMIKLPTVMATPFGFGGGEMPGTEVSSDTYFVLFSSHKITENHKIYLYVYTKASGMSFTTLGFGYMGGKALKNRLVILMDESKDIVEDYVYDKQT
ncbi:hypothetical protein A3G50_02530 [Candidatus Jorgensenbacteria bacterium RIFCSPLOWO2_12_FULL_42_11]|uniref:Lipoprotein SmpA/OmlA domain-containing protein n=1 Tax=Candidatus Jorgensenbacteria bacterium RIFCSPLOWO2_12_FULL_42_11 TaxID=1798473 RepID=A0A1F6C0Q5_9BACT|nr:MAG: hypothetical protein A3G50_02530 [Candidatus Jorgensenbacteria bacterium RIFCSPLOWO2_12_FULL_42_11]